MKRLLTALTIITATANAGDYAFDDFFWSEPEVILSFGESFNDRSIEGDDKTNMFSLTLQEKKCYRYRHCFNPSIIWLNNSEDEKDRLNIGFGLDWKYKVPKGNNQGFHFALGLAGFHNPINGEESNRVNIHTEIGMEISSIIVSVGAYGNPSSTYGNPLYMGNIGYRF